LADALPSFYSLAGTLPSSGSGGCFAAVIMLVGDPFERMLYRLDGLGGCFATFVVLSDLEPLAL